MSDKNISVSAASGKDHCLELAGVLDFDTVSAALEQVGAEIEQRSGESLTLDLTRLKHSNSAALALLVECRALARQHATKLLLTSVPAGVQQLAEVCEADSLLAG